MKLAKDEIARSGDKRPLHLFNQGIRAEETRRKYTSMVRHVLCDVLEDVLDGDLEQRAAQFVQRGREDPEWMLDLLLSLSWKLRGRTELPKDHADYLNPTSVKSYFMPLRKLLEMNNVVANWRRIYTTIPEKDNMTDDTGWTRENIAAMLMHARDPMDRAIILLLASSGVRLGGLNLTWGDLIPIYIENGRPTTDPGGGSAEMACVALNVYAGSPERYTAFATPEAYRAITQYGRVWAERMLRQPSPNDPLFLATKLRPRQASEPAITRRVRQMANKAGLRDPDNKSGNRFVTQLMHGFRKFFNKTCKEALSGDSLASLIRAEYMMGHRGLVALDQNYFKTDMLEMAAEYVKVVPDLTIDDAERLKHTIESMSASIRELEAEKNGLMAQLEKQGAAKDARIAQLEETVRNMELGCPETADAKEMLEKSVEDIRISNEREMRRVLQEYKDAMAKDPPRGDGRPRAGRRQA